MLCNNVKSDYFISMSGVRQDENLSPLLFTLFINDLKDYLANKGNIYLDYGDEYCDNILKICLLLYADDTIILANNALNLQKALNDLRDCCKDWKLQVNADKTKIMIFSQKIVSNKYTFTYDDKKIDVESEFKY